MSPTNLGALATQLPAPTGFGDGGYLAGAQEQVFTNQIPPYTHLFSDANTLRIDASPNGLIRHVRCAAETIWRGADAIQTSIDWGIRLDIPDLDGVQDFRARTWLHSDWTWQSNHVVGTYRLGPGAYNIYLVFMASTIGWAQVVYGSTFCQLFAWTVSEGRI